MNAYAQLLSVGLLWITFHCAGMCGPLVVSFDVAGVARGRSAWRGVVGVLMYQLGRATTLATLGALAGLVGHGLTHLLRPAGAVMALAFGLLVLGHLVWRFWHGRRAAAGPVRVRTRLEGAPRRPGLLARLQPLMLTETLGGTWLLGAVMGLLPCMIVAWALGLAATTASVVDGALVMLLLVVMTTPMLLGVTLLPRILPRRALGALPSVLMAVSALWLVMTGLAGLELAPHLHVAAGDFVVMLW